MKAVKNYLLIGNTRWHWATNKGHEWEYIHTKPNTNMLEDFKSKCLQWAAVGEIPKNNYLDPSQRITIKDIPINTFPHWLGIDRALGAWGAINKAQTIGEFSKGIIVADAGTILSLTCISPTGSFIGGQLIAGLSLQLSTMAKAANDLPSPGSISTIPAMFPIETKEAMKRGALQALISSLAYAQINLKMPLWLCGGDSDLLIEEIRKQKINIKHYPNLVMEGMTLLS